MESYNTIFSIHIFEIKKRPSSTDAKMIFAVWQYYEVCLASSIESRRSSETIGFLRLTTILTILLQTFLLQTGMCSSPLLTLVVAVFLQAKHFGWFGELISLPLVFC